MVFPMRFKDSIDTVLATSFLQVWLGGAKIYMDLSVIFLAFQLNASSSFRNLWNLGVQLG